MVPCQSTTIAFFSSALILLLITGDVRSYRLNTENDRDDDYYGRGAGGCERAVRRARNIDRATVVLDSPNAIFGKWVSENCETRPGPEFLLRSYTFYSNSSFKLVQHYYEDESCSSSAYTVVARGALRSRGFYSLDTVSIIPHATDVAHHLTAKVNATCPGLVRKRWRTSKEYFLLNLSDESYPRSHGSGGGGRSPSGDDEYRGHQSVRKKHFKHHYVGKFNCLHSLSLIFHELHSAKVQIRPSINDKAKTMYYRQELLLGDIHSRIEFRANYTPTAYQVPLLRVDVSVSDALAFQSASLIKSDSFMNIDPKEIEESRGRIYEKSYIGHFDIGTIGELDSILSSKSDERKVDDEAKKNELFNHCHVCLAVATSSEISPPYLISKPRLPLTIGGEWISTQCEQRPMNLFLTRHFRFYEGDGTWIVEYKFFYDTICTGHSFSVTAAGHYNVGKADHFTPGGTEVDFHVEKASMTVFDPNMLASLRHDPDCGTGPWRQGYPRELSSTHGCPTLGLVVPSVEFELLRLEADFYGSSLLYMGLPDTNNRRRGAKERPTSYQVPLLNCDKLPMHSESLKEILTSHMYGDDLYANLGARVLDMDMGYDESDGGASLSCTFFVLCISIFVSIFMR